MSEPQPTPPLSATAPGQAAPDPAQLTLVLLDQHERWQRGERVLVEAYLGSRPALGSDTEKVLDLVYHEIVLREERGESPRLEEYLVRFPQLAEPLRRHFEVHDALRSAVAGAPGGDASLPPAPTAGRPRPTVPGYTVLGLLGRGGMGVVYQARQEKLRRLVALKMLLAGEHAGPAELTRFRREAEAVARLQHPNIVQIFDVGEHEGRPYLALELVAGGSLAQHLGGTPQPPRAAAELVQTLARAVHHAHQHGVLHRDLKPANVLLSFSRDPEGSASSREALPSGSRLNELAPKITDFGLAKWLDAEGHPSHSEALVGTPSYMAPEQAGNRPGQVGPATDVYALGAILYECLTGRPPFRGATLLETLEQIRSQDALSPRLLQPKVPRDLETICLKCLEKEPARRYASAAELADDLRRFLANEPIRARPVGAWGQAVKWARRRPAAAGLIGVSTAAAAALVATLLVSNVSIGREKARAEKNYQTAEAQRRRAEDNLELARQAVDDYITRVGQDPRLRQHDLEGLRRQLLRSALGFYQKFAEQRGDDPKVQAERGGAYLRLGFVTQQVGDLTEAVGLYEQAAALFDRLSQEHSDVAEYRRQLAAARNALGSLHVAAGRHAAAEAEYRQALDLRRRLADEGPDPDRQADVAESQINLGQLYQVTGRPDDAEAAYLAATRLLAPLVKEHPDRASYASALASCRNALGLLYQATGRIDPAETALRQALDLRRHLAHDHPEDPERQRDLAGSHDSLATLYKATGHTAASREPYEQARDVREGLARTHPTVTDYQSDLAKSSINLGNVYQLLSRLGDAETSFRKAADVLRPLVRDHPEETAYASELATSLNNLGILYGSTGRVGPAETAFREALAVREQLATEHPSVPEYQKDLGQAHHNLGNVYRLARRGDDAEAAYKKGLEVREKLARAQPAIPGYQNDVAISHYSLGILYQMLGRPPDQAEAALRKAADVWDALAAAQPAVPEYRKLQAKAHDNIGNIYRLGGRPDRAGQEYRKALEAREELVRQQPAVTELVIDLGGSYCNMGILAQQAGQAEAARDWYAKGLAALEPAYRREPKNPLVRQYLGNARRVWAQVMARLGRHEEALKAWDRALELDLGEDRDAVQGERLHTLLALGDHAGAAAGAEALAKKDRLPPAVRYDLACVYALAAAAAREDEKLTGDERTRTADRYAARALELLAAVEAAGFFKEPDHLEQLRKDPDLDALRPSADFQKLLGRLKGGAR